MITIVPVKDAPAAVASDRSVWVPWAAHMKELKRWFNIAFWCGAIIGTLAGFSLGRVP